MGITILYEVEKNMENQDEIIAYKAFFKGLVNGMDGVEYEIGIPYTTKDNLQYKKGGFHMCQQFEDCFKYLKPTEAEVELALVKGFGHYYSFDAGGNMAYDDTLGYIYICEKMEILKVFTRREIINLALDLDPIRMNEFIWNYPLTEEEIEIIKEKYKYGTKNMKFKVKQKI